MRWNSWRVHAPFHRVAFGPGERKVVWESLVCPGSARLFFLLVKHIKLTPLFVYTRLSQPPEVLDVFYLWWLEA